MTKNKKVVLQIINLTKKYGSFTAIDNLNLEVEQGDFFGFIGPNGAGKSTAINCILNFLFPNQGTIKILGLDSCHDTVAIKKLIGFVPADIFYYDDLKVEDLLNYSNSFYNNIDTTLMNKYIKLFNLPLTKKIGELSSGNKKKVAIVQSLLHKPKLLILDEPSSGLDPLMQSNLFALLETIRQEGTTIFMSSHVLSEVQKYCNKVAFIKGGKIIANGHINHILDKNLKMLKITTNDLLQLKKLIKIKDVQNITTTQNTINLIYKGNINDLLKTLATFNIDDITIQSPDLDDLFLHQYKEDK